MVEAVEKSIDVLIKGDRNSEAYRRMSNESDWSKGKSLLNRTKTMAHIKVCTVPTTPVGAKSIESTQMHNVVLLHKSATTL